jgi:hypothetical protein
MVHWIKYGFITLINGWKASYIKVGEFEGEVMLNTQLISKETKDFSR